MTSELNHHTFLEFEKENGLLDISVQGFYFWQYIRFGFYREAINNKRKPIDSGEHIKDLLPLRRKNKTISDKIFILIKVIRYAIKNNPALYFKKVDILYINHPRRFKNNEHYECIYTDELIKNLSYYRYCVLERFEDFFEEHLRPVFTKNLLYYEAFYLLIRVKRFLGSIFKTHKRYEISRNDEKQLSDIIDKFSEKFNVNIDRTLLINNIQRMINDYKITKIILKNFLKRINPRLIVEVVSYTYETLIINEIAKELGIKVIELQHGSIGSDHIAYNFYEKKELVTFPDYLFLFGSHWKDETRLPLQSDRVFITGFPYFEKRVKQSYKGNNKDEKQVILFISNLQISKELIALACELKELLSNIKYRIIYKLHNGEYEAFYIENRYSSLITSGIEVVKDNNKDIYHYLGISDYLVAVDSTTVYEALPFKIKIFLFKYYNTYLRTMMLSDKGYASVIKSAQDIKSGLNETDASRIEMVNDFWESNSMEKMKYNIEKIMESI